MDRAAAGMDAYGVTSLPEPEVVGIAIKGIPGLLIGMHPRISLCTFPLFLAATAAALAVSRTLPPPIAIIQSGASDTICSVVSWTEAAVGSAPMDGSTLVWCRSNKLSRIVFARDSDEFDVAISMR